MSAVTMEFLTDGEGRAFCAVHVDGRQAAPWQRVPESGSIRIGIGELVSEDAPAVSQTLSGAL